MILITGATGIVGRALMDVFASGRVAARLMARQIQASPGWPEDHEAFAGDVTDEQAVRASMAGVTSVVHLAGVSPGAVPVRPDQEVVAMQTLVAAAVRQGVQRFVFLSASGAAPGSSVAWLREKGRAEAILTASSLTTVVFRSALAFSADDRVINALGAVVRQEERVRLPLFCRGRMRLIAVEDVAIALATSLDHHLVANQAFELGAGEALSLEALLGLIARRLGKRPDILGRFKGKALAPSLARLEHEALPDPRSVLQWFSVAQPAGTEAYDRLLPMKRREFAEGLRNYPWGAPPPRVGDPLPVIQKRESWLPAFIPAPHLRDEESPQVEDVSRLGRVDPFGRVEEAGEEADDGKSRGDHR